MITAINTAIAIQQNTQREINKSLTNLATGSKSGNSSSYNAMIAQQKSKVAAYGAVATNLGVAISIAKTQYDGMIAQKNILDSIKSKTTELSNAALSSAEATAISDSIIELGKSLDLIAANAKYGNEFVLQDTNAIDGTAAASTARDIQTGLETTSIYQTLAIQSNTTGLAITDVLNDTTAGADAVTLLTDVDTALVTLNGNIAKASGNIAGLEGQADALASGLANAKNSISLIDGVDYASEKEVFTQLNSIHQGAVFAGLKANEFQKNIMKLLDPQYA
jgi:flagellin-like hook-associated protein FlgL